MKKNIETKIIKINCLLTISCFFLQKKEKPSKIIKTKKSNTGELPDTFLWSKLKENPSESNAGELPDSRPRAFVPLASSWFASFSCCEGGWWDAWGGNLMF